MDLNEWENHYRGMDRDVLEDVNNAFETLRLHDNTLFEEFEGLDLIRLVAHHQTERGSRT